MNCKMARPHLTLDKWLSTDTDLKKDFLDQESYMKESLLTKLDKPGQNGFRNLHLANHELSEVRVTNCVKFVPNKRILQIQLYTIAMVHPDWVRMRVRGTLS